MREYELWIDESGRFVPEDEANMNLNPSLIGGILIEKGKLQSRTITRLVNSDKVGIAHAMNYDRSLMRDVVLKALEEIRRRGGHIFYIENQERIQTLSNRDLYLRMLAGGLVQLMMTLSQESEEGFVLDATIAMRSVHETDDPYEKGILIEDDEYVSTLKEYIRDCWKSDKFDIELDCILNVSIQDARREERLQLADYACNARLTRNSRKFSEEMRTKLRSLMESRYIYKVYVNLAENRISSAVATGDIAEALMVYFTTRDSGLDRTACMLRIADRVSAMSYRLNSLNLESFTDQIVTYVRAETDFERSESILNQVLKDIPFIYKNIQIPSAPSLMRINFCLSDMYLREGDIRHAETAISAMRDNIASMGNKLENLKWLYFYNDRRALYQIRCMDYEAAVATIEKSVDTMTSMISVIDFDKNVESLFSEKKYLHSEYLGNALCMKILAELLEQKTDPSVYERSLKADLENAIAQYDFEGGKERNLQYRSYAEATAGMYDASFDSLIRSACLESSGDVKKDGIAYLEKAQQEDKLSRTYYLMYYLYLMNEALCEENGSLSLSMYDALIDQRSIYDEFLKERPSDSRKVTNDGEHVIYRDIFGGDIADSHYEYHPLEIVLWKYGAFLRDSGKDRSAADDYYKAALNICHANPDYDFLKMVYIAIEMERIAAYDKDKAPDWIWNSLRNEVRDLYRITTLQPGIRHYVSDAKELIDRHYKYDDVTKEELMRMTARVGY